MLPGCLVAFVACTHSDPCEGISATCVTLHVTSQVVHEIDQLELDISYGSHHAATTTQGMGPSALPLEVAVELDLTEMLAVGIVAAGKLSGTVLGTGAAAMTVTSGSHVSFEILLALPAICVAGGFYCGGDKVAGDPSTLYQCNGGGVPNARGVCAQGCIVSLTGDDGCRGVGGTCVDGGLYCGGDKLDGDPQTLYRCTAGTGTVVTRCTNGCAIRPSPQADGCK